ncbi:hypothetical protein CVIRNUC_006307 [Coccomyxa viridis]|uniref:Extracellular protein n=1 Tax=Coccomyxa viridis TaxID=1274662 RepID=A0AAV1I8T2_9CHLO|nr:hypothetical protein CVIRNUC_006307 [Coccomyxa viridis]
MSRAGICLLLLSGVLCAEASENDHAPARKGRSLHFFLPPFGLGAIGHWAGFQQQPVIEQRPAVQAAPVQPQPVTPSPIPTPISSPPPSPILSPPLPTPAYSPPPPSPVASPPPPSPNYNPPPPSPVASPPPPAPSYSPPSPSPAVSPPPPSPAYSPSPPSPIASPPPPSPVYSPPPSPTMSASPSATALLTSSLAPAPGNAGGTAAGTKAGVVSGVRQGDTDAAAHAIANAPPEGQGASDALGQLYNEANNTGLESDLAKKITDTMAQASRFNLDAAARAFYNGASKGGPSADAMALAVARAFIGGGDEATQFVQTIQRAIQLHNCSDGLQATLAEAQSLASSQAGDAGAAAFSDAVYNYTAVRMCLGGRAMQAENAAAGKPLNPQPPPPPPLSGALLPSSNTPVSLSGSGMPNGQPSQAPSMQQGTRTLLRHTSSQVGDIAPQVYLEYS